MPSRGFHKNSHPEVCNCPAWLIDAVHDVLYRSPIRLKEIVYRLNEEMYIHVAESTLISYCTKPTRAAHRCLPGRLIIPLTKASENTHLIDEQERQIGREIPRSLRPVTETIEASCLDLLIQAGILSTEAARKLKQGLNPQVLIDLKPHVNDMRQQLDAFDGAAGHVIYGRLA